MTTWEQVLEAVQTTLQGDRERGRTLMDDAFAGTDDPAQRCVLAHWKRLVRQSIDCGGRGKDHLVDARLYALSGFLTVNDLFGHIFIVRKLYTI